ncbi:unnamed protein product [Callosobruchus maculatus]|uniref:Uncharacterized protein n=1 Tax=Callosobruchus maculatus TaxID=64391 RepID=A0A653CEW4_CALMS|nr:unnamed protein product [Callosobruchus maculatus]
MQFENIARMNNWSNEEKACVLTSMLRDSAAAILENLCSSDLRDYDKITSALRLRFGDAHLTELLHGQLHSRTQQAKEDLTTLHLPPARGRAVCMYFMQGKFSDAVSHHPLLQSLSRSTAREKPLSSECLGASII